MNDLIGVLFGCVYTDEMKAGSIHCMNHGPLRRNTCIPKANVRYTKCGFELGEQIRREYM